MKIIKTAFMIMLFAICAPQKAECKYITVSFFINGKMQSNPKYYLIKNKKGHLLNSLDNAIDIPDSLKDSYEILLVYKKFHTIIAALAPGISHLDIYFDNRIFHNLANKRSGGSWFTLRYIFKKKYIIVYGNGRLSVNPQSKKDYSMRYEIPEDL